MTDQLIIGANINFPLEAASHAQVQETGIKKSFLSSADWHCRRLIYFILFTVVRNCLCSVFMECLERGKVNIQITSWTQHCKYKYDYEEWAQNTKTLITAFIQQMTNVLLIWQYDMCRVIIIITIIIIFTTITEHWRHIWRRRLGAGAGRTAQDEAEQFQIYNWSQWQLPPGLQQPGLLHQHQSPQRDRAVHHQV